MGTKIKINDNLHKKYIDAAKYVVALISVILLILNISSFRMYPLNYILGLEFIGNVLILILLLTYNFDYKFIQSAIPIYLIFIEICIYPFAMFWWEIGQITPFIWFLLIPMGSIMFDIKKMFLSNCITFILIVSIFVLCPFLKLELNLSPAEIARSNIMTVIGSFAITLMMVWHYNKMTVAFNDSNVQLADDLKPETEETGKVNDEDKEKLKALYSEIQEYFEKQQPYCNSKFNIVQLANKLNINVNYVSRAIKLYDKTNFNQFINKYRINLIVSMLDDGQLSHYTLLHIYTKAGFKYQSTFNAAFRKVMNMTPSEYIASKKIQEIPENTEEDS